MENGIGDGIEPKGYDTMPSKRKNVLTLLGNTPENRVELGIDAVLALVDGSKEFAEAYAIVMEDGKVTIGDFLGHPIEVVWEPAVAIIGIWNVKELLLAQITDIDFSEAEEIIEAIKVAHNLSGTTAESLLRHLILGTYHYGEVAKIWINSKK